MGLIDFLQRPSAFGTEAFEAFYEILCHGGDAEIASLIYRRHLLSPAEIRSSVNAIAFHCRALNKDGRLIEKERVLSPNATFVLLMVVGSWAEDNEDNLVPLIVSLVSRRIEIAGIVLPFDGLMMKNLGSAGSQIGNLSAFWVARKIANDMSPKTTDLGQDDNQSDPEGVEQPPSLRSLQGWIMLHNPT